jgi:thiol:disulfide interchange protein
MRLHLLTLAVLAGPAAIVSAGDPQELWHPDYESAAAAADESGRPMLIHFHAKWCGPCRQMEARVLNQPSLREGLRDRVVAVKVDYDRHADLVERFGVAALPCDLLVDADGTVLLRTTGFVGETTYVERIARLAPVAAQPQLGLVAMSFTMPAHVGGAQYLGAVQGVGTRLLAGSGR